MPFKTVKHGVVNGKCEAFKELTTKLYLRSLRHKKVTRRNILDALTASGKVLPSFFKSERFKGFHGGVGGGASENFRAYYDSPPMLVIGHRSKWVAPYSPKGLMGKKPIKSIVPRVSAFRNLKNAVIPRF